MKKILCFLIPLAFAISCKEAYNVPSPSPPTGYLVVEGFINSGDGPTVITLSRTTKLYDSVDIVYEYRAQVSIEGENSETFALSETGNGTYTSEQLSLNSNEKYRIHISTQDGKEYQSDFAAVKTTPPIDSISWKRENGVGIYINTHDPLNNTRYYQWKYEETWEFHSAFPSSLKYSLDETQHPYGVEYRLPTQGTDTLIYKCYQNINSTSITLGSSEKLAEDKIFLPLLHIDPGTEQISVLYSIHVRQYALSHQAYLFFDKIKKNTEGLGSIFDAQPSDLQGNVHCISNPSEIVVGFVEVSQEQDKRIFISRDQVPDWGYATGCVEIALDNNKDSIHKYGEDLMPTMPIKIGPFNSIVTFHAAPRICVDCTLRGSNRRPAFWP